MQPMQSGLIESKLIVAGSYHAAIRTFDTDKRSVTLARRVMVSCNATDQKTSVH
jgi:hypothetical protein